jgi:hypothetical protein
MGTREEEKRNGVSDCLVLMKPGEGFFYTCETETVCT